MMVSLRLAGKLKKLAGLVVGHFTGMKDNDDPFGKKVREILYDAVGDYAFPVAFGFPAGHEQPNLALVSGGIYTLEAGTESCTLTLENF
jgi:muramoyltetrapeptide carboxypeptidase